MPNLQSLADILRKPINKIEEEEEYSDRQGGNQQDSKAPRQSVMNKMLTATGNNLRSQLIKRASIFHTPETQPHHNQHGGQQHGGTSAPILLRRGSFLTSSELALQNSLAIHRRTSILPTDNNQIPFARRNSMLITDKNLTNKVSDRRTSIRAYENSMFLTAIHLTQQMEDEKQKRKDQMKKLLAQKLKENDPGFFTIAFLNDGQAFGEMALIHNKPRMATVRCVQKTHLIVLTKEAFEAVIGKMEKRLLNEKLDFMQNLPFFHMVARNTIARITYSLKKKTYKKGQMLFREGDDAKTVYLIMSGEVEITKIRRYKTDPESHAIGTIVKDPLKAKKQQTELFNKNNKTQRQHLSLFILGRGQLIGDEDVILEKDNYQTTCKCISSHIDVFELTREEFRKIIQTGPNTWSIIKENAEKKGKRIEQISEFHNESNFRQIESSKQLRKIDMIIKTPSSAKKDEEPVSRNKPDFNAPAELSKQSLQKLNEIIHDAQQQRQLSPVRSPQYKPGQRIFRNIDRTPQMIDGNVSLGQGSSGQGGAGNRISKDSQLKIFKNMQSIGSVSHEDSDSLVESESIISELKQSVESLPRKSKVTKIVKENRRTLMISTDGLPEIKQGVNQLLSRNSPANQTATSQKNPMKIFLQSAQNQNRGGMQKQYPQATLFSKKPPMSTTNKQNITTSDPQLKTTINTTNLQEMSKISMFVPQMHRYRSPSKTQMKFFKKPSLLEIGEIPQNEFNLQSVEIQKFTPQIVSVKNEQKKFFNFEGKIGAGPKLARLSQQDIPSITYKMSSSTTSNNGNSIFASSLKNSKANMLYGILRKSVVEQQYHLQSNNR
ncbi:hypothetical protein FGO68_gene16462 [Halteria grandinella]|uniref:Cyclic nucleotide-binding domain-containing protein n=1 Tax=Halteria grandinella TaxID=5974 RepID=A0A8J8P3C9_HALGN|nr:hypothetical protein FGO68_gene16462 [Halteria grandinella]